MSAVLTIPAKYLEDVRAALQREIALDGDAFQRADPADQAVNVRIISRDLDLFQQILGADSDTVVSSEKDGTSSPVTHTLEAVVRVLAARLDEEKEYGPINMGAVLDIAEELRWAATEAIRIEPRLDKAA
jgi:hypothetical protein